MIQVVLVVIYVYKCVKVSISGYRKLSYATKLISNHERNMESSDNGQGHDDGNVIAKVRKVVTIYYIL